MTRILSLALACVLVSVLGAAPLAAANREHQVMMAEIRMLQEQNAQLQQVLNGLTDTLKALNAKIDDQAGLTRKAFADQRLTIDNLGESVRIVREKVDETNVRIATLAQDIESIRSNALSQPVAPATVDPNAPAAPVTDPNAPPATGTTPKQLFDLAFGDYTAGQWDLAIQGFQTYLKAYPKSPMSSQAAFYIGQAHYAAGRFKEAVAAFDQLIATYPGDAERLADAYYKRGLAYERLGQIDRAKQSFEYVIKNFSESSTATLAKQSLERLSKPGA